MARPEHPHDELLYRLAKLRARNPNLPYTKGIRQAAKEAGIEVTPQLLDTVYRKFKRKKELPQTRPAVSAAIDQEYAEVWRAEEHILGVIGETEAALVARSVNPGGDLTACRLSLEKELAARRDVAEAGPGTAASHLAQRYPDPESAKRAYEETVQEYETFTETKRLVGRLLDHQAALRDLRERFGHILGKTRPVDRKNTPLAPDKRDLASE